MKNVIELGDRVVVNYANFYYPHIKISRENGKEGGLSIAARFYDGAIWFAKWSNDWNSKKTEKTTIVKTDVSAVTVIASRYGGKKGVSEMTNDVMEMCSKHMDPKAKIVPYNSDGTISIHFKRPMTCTVEGVEEISYEPDINVEAVSITKDDIEAIGIINSITIMLDRVAVFYRIRKEVAAEIYFDAPSMSAYGKSILQLAADVCDVIGGGPSGGNYIGVLDKLGDAFVIPGADRRRPLIAKSRLEVSKQRFF